MFQAYHPLPVSMEQRRARPERRHFSLRSLLRGGQYARRRRSRRLGDKHAFATDWYDSRLLYLCLGILLLSTADAILTLNLLQVGAIEINPVMHILIHNDIQLFAAGKMALTSGGLLLLVMRAEHCAFGLFRVHRILAVLLPAYLLLILYEAAMLAHLA